MPIGSKDREEMAPIANRLDRAKRAAKADVTRKQIRGSSLLLAGKFLSVGINFASQVLVVRYLSTTDYGAWVYALSMVALCQGFASLGLDRAITRFVPIYHEKHEYDKLFGAILLVFGSILITGVLVIASFYAFPAQIARLTNENQQPLVLLFIMIFLVPIEVVDGLLIGLFASFSSPRAIFFRKHVLGPGLKLLVILLLVLWRSDIAFLAYGYLIASVIGVLICFWVLVRLLRSQGLLRELRFKDLKIPAREIFAFTIPMMTSDLLTVVMHSADALLLGYFKDMTEVALYRVVLPAAALNKIVMISFGLLYTPLAARLFAKGNYAGINDLYWRTAIWMTVLSFPVFALTFSMARPLTVFLYGPRYQQSSVILAILSLGYYFSVALGFNGLTLKVLGKVRYVVIINVLALVTNLALNLLLIPAYGAVGAAIGTAGTMIVHNIFKQAGLRLASGISLFDKSYLPFYVIIASCAIGLFCIQFLGSGSIYVAIAGVGCASLLVLALTKKHLNVVENFPELLKVPFIRLIFT